MLSVRFSFHSFSPFSFFFSSFFMLQLSSFQSIFHKSRFTIWTFSLSISRCIWLFYDGISETWPTRFTFEFEITYQIVPSLPSPLFASIALNVLESRKDRGIFIRVCPEMFDLLIIDRTKTWIALSEECFFFSWLSFGSFSSAVWIFTR